MRLFVDRDLGKRLPRALQTVGQDATAHIERYPRADAETVEDRAWIHEAATRDELILTRDGGVRRRDVEIAAIAAARARCIVLETGNATPFVYLRAVMIAWPKIERLVADQAPPWVYGLNRDGRLVCRYPRPQ